VRSPDRVPRNAAAQLTQAFAWVMLLCLLAECAHAAEAAAIEWVTAELAGRPGQRIAMLVNAQIDGKSCAMQMDTGMDGAVAWHQYSSSPGETAEVTVAFVGVTRRVVATQATRRSVAACTSGSPVGSLGNAFFDHGTLSLDLRAGRLSFSPGSALAMAEDTLPMLYVRAASGGRPLVEVRSRHGLQGHALLDTGSAALGLVVPSAAHWSRWTGGAELRADAPGVTSFRVHSWGRDHTCYLTEGGLPMQLGALHVAAPRVSFCPDMNLQALGQLEGIAGMQSFQGLVVTLDYPAGRWRVSRPEVDR
jgi:hypothetical protein